MSIFSHLIDCFFSFWTETRYQKLNSFFVIILMILLVLSMTVVKVTGGEEISRTDLAGLKKKIPMHENDHTGATQFESEKKESDIRIKDQNIRILSQQAKIEHANLRQATLKQSIAIACAALLIIVVGLVYVHYHKKQRDNGIITEHNKDLQQLIEEKEWLVKEIHHRVTNNLHTVISLLESQAMFLRDDALKAIQISQHRIYAMLLIHQKLYRSDDVKTIDMKIYLAELIQYFKDGFTIKGKIHITLFAETLKLDVSQATPLALIINEALTNAIKHAFPGTRAGNIVITLSRMGKAAIMEIEDNGVGMPPGIKTSALNSLGLQLMRGLSNDLNAKYNICSKKGTKVAVIFDVKIKSTDSNSIHEKSLISQSAERKGFQSNTLYHFLPFKGL